eukprot:GGOE01000418.1.p1 GENE.GGOE01000418.1~~GGOE01000418.1.p1  ORF type:complete len:516 (+),score=76.42 GGOE01000418.1:66-1613(+)
MAEFPLNQRAGSSPIFIGNVTTASLPGPSYYTSPAVPPIQMETSPQVTQITSSYYPALGTYSVAYEAPSPVASRSGPRNVRTLSLGSVGSTESAYLRPSPIFPPARAEYEMYARDPYPPNRAPLLRNPPHFRAPPDGLESSRFRAPSPHRPPSLPIEPRSPRGAPLYPRYHVPRYSHQPQSPQRPVRPPSVRRREFRESHYRTERSLSESYYTGRPRDPSPPPPEIEAHDKARRAPVEQRWKGTLNARVIRATDLRRPGGTTHGTCVEVSVVGAKFQSDAVRTDVVTDPVMQLWDQAVIFSCPLEQREGELVSVDELDVRVLDVRADGEETIGGATVPLSVLVKGRQTPMTVDLMGQGFLHLILEAVDFGHGKRAEEVGNLLVRVQSGLGVTNGEVVGTLPDTYVVVSCMGQEFQTRIQWNTRDPEWNEDFAFKMPVAQRQNILVCDSYLNVQVFDRNSGRSGVDAFLGGAQISLEGLEHQRPTPAPVELKAGGTVLLQLVALSFGAYRPQQVKK